MMSATRVKLTQIVVETQRQMAVPPALWVGAATLPKIVRRASVTLASVTCHRARTGSRMVKSFASTVVADRARQAALMAMIALQMTTVSAVSVAMTALALNRRAMTSYRMAMKRAWTVVAAALVAVAPVFRAPLVTIVHLACAGARRAGSACVPPQLALTASVTKMRRMLTAAVHPARPVRRVVIAQRTVTVAVAFAPFPTAPQLAYACLRAVTTAHATE
mmetsp:Transcript_45263/g.108181  ORF Transcript_45263/g.108181 Transcript_45263/m.108181 type:complete len:220 (+) Transcript_45263:2065-2724(+)